MRWIQNLKWKVVEGLVFSVYTQTLHTHSHTNSHTHTPNTEGYVIKNIIFTHIYVYTSQASGILNLEKKILIFSTSSERLLSFKKFT